MANIWIVSREKHSQTGFEDFLIDPLRMQRNLPLDETPLGHLLIGDFDLAPPHFYHQLLQTAASPRHLAQLRSESALLLLEEVYIHLLRLFSLELII